MASQVDFSSIASGEFPAIVFVNPAADGGRAGAHLPRIRNIFETHGLPAEFVLTKSAEELEAVAREKMRIMKRRRLLLAMGGDGTFQGLANAAFGSDILLGILPAGGGLYVGGGGVGLDAEAAAYASGAYRRFPGRLRYIAAALRALRGFAPLQVRAEFPESELPPIESKVLLAGVLNTPTYGAGLRLAPEAQISDGWIDAVFLDDLSFWGVLKLLPRLMRSGDLQTPQVKRIRAKRVKLTTGKPCMFHGDGEIIGPTPVEIEVVPHAVQLLAPVVG